MVERAGRGKSTRHREKNHAFALEELLCRYLDRAVCGLLLEGGVGQLVSDGNVTGISSFLCSSGVSQDYRIGSIKGKRRFHAAAARAQGERDRLSRDVLVLPESFTGTSAGARRPAHREKPARRKRRRTARRERDRLARQPHPAAQRTQAAACRGTHRISR